MIINNYLLFMDATLGSSEQPKPNEIRLTDGDWVPATVPVRLVTDIDALYKMPPSALKDGSKSQDYYIVYTDYEVVWTNITTTSGPNGEIVKTAQSPKMTVGKSGRVAQNPIEGQKEAGYDLIFQRVKPQLSTRGLKNNLIKLASEKLLQV